MVTIKLRTSYLNNAAGDEIEVDQEKADQLVKLGRAEIVKTRRSVKKEDNEPSDS